MENKFCLKSRQELAEIRQAKEEKKNSMSEMNIPGIMTSLKQDYESGKITAKEVAKELARAGWTPFVVSDKEALEKIGAKNESKINEISDELADKVANKRKVAGRFAADKFRRIDDTHTAELSNVFRKYTDKDIISGKADKEVEDIDKRYEPIENEQRKIIKKAEKNQELMAKRNARKAQSESVVNEISDETVNNAFTKLDAEFDKEAIKWGVKPYKRGVSKSFDKAFDRYERFGKLNKKRLERKYKSESLTASKALAMSKSILDEISDETVNKVYNKRVKNYAKAQSKFNHETGEGFGDLVDAEQKLDRNLTLNLARDRRDREARKARQAKSESVNEELQVGDTARYNGHVWVKVKSIEGNKALVSPIHQEDVEKGNFGEEEFVMLDDLEKQPKLRESKINENEAILEAIKEDIMNAVKERYGDDPDTLDWIYVDVERREDGYVRVELRAELDYEGMDNLTDYLKPIIKKYDKQAYFDMDSPGIAEAILEVEGIEESLNEESLNEELAPEHTQEAYDKIEDIANDKLKELVREHDDNDPEVENIVSELVMEYIKSIPSDDILHMYLEMGFDEPQLVAQFRPLVEDELVRFFNNKFDDWKEYAYDVLGYEQDESLNAKSALDKSKEILEGMIDKYGREVDPKEWEEKEAKGLNEVSDKENKIINKIDKMMRDSKHLDQETGEVKSSKLRNELDNLKKEQNKIFGGNSFREIVNLLSKENLQDKDKEEILKTIEPIKNYLDGFADENKL